MDDMKKILAIVFFILFYASGAFADEVDEALPPNAAQQVKAGTRQMIRSGISSEDATKLTRAMLENTFNNDQIMAAHNVIINGSKEGLPVMPIINKAFEGIVKHAKAESIVQAMETVRSRYSFAYRQAETITPQKSQVGQMGNMLAAGLSAGLNHEDTERIINMLQRRVEHQTPAQASVLVEEALKTARDMARVGVSSELTAGMVRHALQKEYSETEMKSMRSSFISRSGKSSMNSFAMDYLNAMQGGKSPQDLEAMGMGQSGSQAGSFGMGDSGGHSGMGDSGGSGGMGDSGGSSGMGDSGGSGGMGSGHR